MTESTYMPTEAQIRAIAKEEAHKALASLSGLVLRRLQDDQLSRDPDTNHTFDMIDARLNKVFGEALEQYGS